MNNAPMRRKERELDFDEAMDVLKAGNCGVLATVSPDGQCYGVPLNHVVYQNRIYFHCANTGLKTDNIAHNPNVTFTVITRCDVAIDDFTTLYTSAIAYGRALVVTDIAEKREALLALCERFGADMDKSAAAIDPAMDVVSVIRVDIDRVTGKANKGTTPSKQKEAMLS